MPTADDWQMRAVKDSQDHQTGGEKVEWPWRHSSHYNSVSYYKAWNAEKCKCILLDGPWVSYHWRYGHKKSKPWVVWQKPQLNHITIIQYRSFQKGLLGGLVCCLWYLFPVVCPPFMFYSLDAKGDEGHADHEQIQDVKVISAKRALVEECPISSHLQGVTENKSMSGYWQDRETISLTYTNSPPTPTPFHTHITYVRTYIHAYIHTPPFPPAASLGQDSIKEQWEDWGRTERQDWKRTVLRKGLYNQLNTTKIFPVYDVQMAPFLTKILQSSIWNPLDQILSSCFYFHNSQVPHNLVMMSMEDFPGKQNSQPLQILPRC